MVHCWGCVLIQCWALSTPIRDTKSGNTFLTEKQGEARREGGKELGWEGGRKGERRECNWWSSSLMFLTGMFGRYFLSRVSMRRPSVMLRWGHIYCNDGDYLCGAGYRATKNTWTPFWFAKLSTTSRRRSSMKLLCSSLRVSSPLKRSP